MDRMVYETQSRVPTNLILTQKVDDIVSDDTQAINPPELGDN